MRAVNPNVELITTGSELLTGRTINRHAHTLGAALPPLGLHLSRDTTVLDDIDVIMEALQEALKRVDIVFLSGGLGPTEDDVTRDAIAKLFNRKIIMDEAALAAMRERYREYGRELTKPGERQALVIEGADVLPNSVGAAPGERIECDAKILFVLPGPPAEFNAVLTEHVLPWLGKNVGQGSQRLEETFVVCGLGESDILGVFEAEAFPQDGIRVAYRASPGRVEIRLSHIDHDRREILSAADKLRGILGGHVVADRSVELEEIVGLQLQESGRTLAVAESCTGGMLAQKLTSVPGSSGYFRGGVVAYSNDVKVNLLGVDRSLLEEHGAVSGEVARAMAEGAAFNLGADYGLSTTGIAGPDGGTKEKPVGLVFMGVHTPNGTHAVERRFIGDRESIRERTCHAVLDLLRRSLNEGRLQG